MIRHGFLYRLINICHGVLHRSIHAVARFAAGLCGVLGFPMSASRHGVLYRLINTVTGSLPFEVEPLRNIIERPFLGVDRSVGALLH